MSMHRDRKLLDLARKAPCFLRIQNVCESERFPSVPAHSNLLRHGRGAYLKSHDCFAIAACGACHDWLDKGGAPRDEKEAAVEVGLEAYWLYLWQHNLIMVNPNPDYQFENGEKP